MTRHRPYIGSSPASGTIAKKLSMLNVDVGCMLELGFHDLANSSHTCAHMIIAMLTGYKQLQGKDSINDYCKACGHIARA